MLLFHLAISLHNCQTFNHAGTVLVTTIETYISTSPKPVPMIIIVARIFSQKVAPHDIVLQFICKKLQITTSTGVLFSENTVLRIWNQKFPNDDYGVLRSWQSFAGSPMGCDSLIIISTFPWGIFFVWVVLFVACDCGVRWGLTPHGIMKLLVMFICLYLSLVCVLSIILKDRWRMKKRSRGHAMHERHSWHSR